MRTPRAAKPAAARAARVARHARHARPAHRAVAILRLKLGALAVAALTVMASGALAAVQVRPATAFPGTLSALQAKPAPVRATLPAPPGRKAAPRIASKSGSAPRSRPASKSRPRQAHKPASTPASSPTSKPASAPPSAPTHQPAPTPAQQTSPASAPPVTVSSARKGVSAVDFTGVGQALTESGASWYYNWAATPNGIAAPSSVPFVPMLWNASDVTAANLDAAEQESSYLLGFNEPDMSSQANMSPQQALSLWPRLMATGMTLGSPAVSSGAATPGGWLDQFMAGARADGYRVDFITVHWYGGDFSTGPAVQELESYLQAIYDRYHLPIWLTEFALIGYDGSTAIYPTQAQQAAFLTAATTMLDGLSYVQRYAWFSLPTSNGFGTTGLFSPGPVVTPVGEAFEAAR